MVQLNPKLADSYEFAVMPPCNPAYIAGDTYHFDKLTVAQADKLIAIGSPYVRKKEAATAPKKAVTEAKA